MVAWKGLKVLAKKLDCTLRKTEAPEGCRTVLTCRKPDPCCVNARQKSHGPRVGG